MTRKKEIEQAMKESVAETIYVGGWGMTSQATDLLECAFTKGAEWADTTMLDKVCKWLEENVEYAVMKKNGKHTIELASMELVEDLQKDMRIWTKT